MAAAHIDLAVHMHHLIYGAPDSVHNFFQEFGNCPVQDVGATKRMIVPLVDYRVCEHMEA
jgi:hypothetical protein